MSFRSAQNKIRGITAQLELRSSGLGRTVRVHLGNVDNDDSMRPQAKAAIQHAGQALFDVVSELEAELDDLLEALED